MNHDAAITTLSALAQETRLDVFRLLVRSGGTGLSAGAIGERLGVPAATLSFHLKELRHADVVQAEKHGRSIIYRAHFATVRELVGYLLANCCRGDGVGSGAADDLPDERRERADGPAAAGARA